MSAQLDGIRDLAAAAQGLTLACVGRIESMSATLHRNCPADRRNADPLTDRERIAAGLAPMHAPVWDV